LSLRNGFGFVSLRDGLILMRASARSLHFESGGCAATPFFLLLTQKKEGKEKGTLLPRPSAILRVLSLTGARQLAALRHASLSSCQGLRCSTR
jgi:hypothetical protein